MDLSTLEVDTVFADLMCADPQWLAEEFDALISASYGKPPGTPPPAPPRIPPYPGTRRSPSRQPVQGTASIASPPIAGPGHCRQRSPPL